MPQPAITADLPQLAAVLAQAFRDYAWTRWTVPADRHAQRLQSLQQIYLEHVGYPHGMVWTVRDLNAVAAFIPAGAPEPPPAVLEHIVAHHGDRLQALLNAEELLNRHRPDYDWSLATAAVAPSAQGRGLGSAVVMAGLARIDEQNGSCLVETSDPKNLSFYRRLGFETVDIVKTSGPSVWMMLRPAGARM